jgi:hypothetical protein
MEGAQRLLRNIFKALEKSGEKKLFRQAPYSAPKAFDEAYQLRKTGGGMGLHGEPGGIYYAENPYDIPALRSGAGTPREDAKRLHRRMVSEGKTIGGDTKTFSDVAITLPGARHKEFTAEEWAKLYQKEPFEPLTRKLKKDYDFVTFPDIATGHPNIKQTVQLNPRKSIVNTLPSWRGPGGYTVVGAAGLGLVAGDMLSAKDADAMPLGKHIPGVFKTFQQAMRSKTSLGAEMKKAGQRIPAKSSANERLLGKPLQGSKISGVYQGVGDSRYIHLEDGRVFPTNKESLNELCAEFGTQDYMKAFQDKSKEAQWDQILKSYKMNQKRGTPSRTSGGRKPDRIRILEDSLTDRQGMIGNDAKVADQVLVQDNETKMWWLWPRIYAEPAEAAGLIKIDKAKNTLFTNKGL